MNRFTLEFKFFTETSKKQDALLIKRKFPKIKFSSWLKRNLEVGLKVIANQSSHLTSLTFKMETFESKTFGDLLSSLKMLRSLQILHCHFNNINEVEAKPLHTLTDLKIVESFEAFKFFTKSNIKSLNATETLASDLEILNDFLMTQGDLEKLEIVLSAYEPRTARSEFTMNASFRKLKKFSITAPKYFTVTTKSQLMKSLHTNGRFLEELELKCQAAPEVYKFIFTQLKFLKTLTVDAALIPRKAEFYQNLKPSTSIKHVTLIYDSWCAGTRRFLNCFSHIESFSTIYVDQCEIAMGAEEVSWSNIFLHTGSIWLPNLKSIQVHQVDSLVKLKAMLCFHPNIESISIHKIYTSGVKKELLKILANFGNIKHLKVRGGEKAMQQFFFFARNTNFTKLESMELIVYRIDEPLERKFYFNMPRNDKLDQRWWKPNFYLNPTKSPNSFKFQDLFGSVTSCHNSI